MKMFCTGIVVFALILGACADPTTTAAALVPGVQIEGVVYTPTGYAEAPPNDLGAQVASVLRLVDCSEGLQIADDTWVSDHCILTDGDSNFLAAGTPIFGMDDASGNLVAHSPALGSATWVTLEPAVPEL